MEFAADKCKVLRVTRKLKRNIIFRSHKINKFTLESVSSAKYLGVTFDSKLSFKEHIQDIIKKANSTRQFLQRVLYRCDSNTKATCYKTYVRPFLEYASTSWDPHKGNDSNIKSLESVQNKAARYVNSDWRRTSSVSKMVSDLNWESLQERCARACVIMMHKIQNYLVAIPPTLFSYSTYGMSTRGAPTKIIIPPI